MLMPCLIRFPGECLPGYLRWGCLRYLVPRLGSLLLKYSKQNYCTSPEVGDPPTLTGRPRYQSSPALLYFLNRQFLYTRGKLCLLPLTSHRQGQNQLDHHTHRNEPWARTWNCVYLMIVTRFTLQLNYRLIGLDKYGPPFPRRNCNLIPTFPGTWNHPLNRFL